MMVQLQSWERLIHKISFGTVEDTEDDNGMPVHNFKQIGTPTLWGKWTLTTAQMIQNAGLNKTDSFIIVVHHRRSWEGITHAMIGDKLYTVSNINPGSYQNPTAGDLLILQKVSERND